MASKIMDIILYALEKAPYFIVRVFAICIFFVSIWLWLNAYGYMLWANIISISAYIVLIAFFIYGIYKCYKEYEYPIGEDSDLS